MTEGNRIAAKPADPWRQYRLGKRLLFGGLALYLPAMVAANYALKALGFGDDASVYPAAAWMAAWAIGSYWLSRFMCPQCGARFFQWGTGRLARANLFATKCQRCGERPR